MNELTRIWSERAAAFWKEAGIYWSYAARSGLSAFLLLFFIIGSYAYMKVLKTLPADYPYWRVTTPLLGAVLAWTPIRTFLKPADLVFLMPAESRLGAYRLRCLIYAYFFQATASGLVLLLVWPLYRHCEGREGTSFLAALAALLAAKLVTLVSRCQENKLVYAIHRAAVSFFRWCGAVLTAFALLTQGIVQAVMFAALFAVLITVAASVLPRHRIPWEYWARKEAGHLKVHYAFFSWFADVPRLQVKPKPRMLLARFVDRLPFDKSETYRYLFAKTILRSELFGILLRIMVIAVLLFLLVENVVAEPLIYVTALFMLAATVSSLDQSHKYSFWPELYPVPGSYRSKAIMSTALWILLPLHTLMGAAFLAFHTHRLNALFLIASGFLFILYFVYVPLRKRTAAREE